MKLGQSQNSSEIPRQSTLRLAISLANVPKKMPACEPIVFYIVLNNISKEQNCSSTVKRKTSEKKNK